MTATEMNELMTRPEELDEELRFYVQGRGSGGQMIHHPLVIELFYRPGYAGMVNLLYRQKKYAITEALDKQNWSTFMWLHERPYRLMALKRLMPYLDDKNVPNRLDREESKYKLIASAWNDSENIHQNKMDWVRILKSLPEPHRLMDYEEQDKLVYMPDPVVIWRGDHNPKWLVKGISWTVDEERARWFAHRFEEFKGGAFLGKALVPKKKILAFFDSRGESEVIVLPRIDNIEITELKPNQK